MTLRRLRPSRAFDLPQSDRYNVSSAADKLEALRTSRAYTDAQAKPDNVVAHPSAGATT